MANSKNITFDQLQAALSRVKSALDGKANTSHGNHVPKTETANNARFLRNDNTWQTITPVNIGAADRSHSHGSYVNQNAFSNIKVGDTTVAADSPTDTLTLTAGANVTITPDATNDSVTIAAKDTVYTHPTTSGYKHIPSGGSSGQILRWSADGTAAWGSDNNTDTKVTNTLNTTAKAYVTGTTSATTNTGTQVFDTGVYLDTTAGKLVATTFAGALSGNATSATSLQTARKFTIGNTERTFNGSGDVKWTLADIGAAASSHSHSYVPLSNGGSTTIVADSDASTTTEYAQLQAGHNYLRVTSSAGGSTTTQGADKLTFNGNVVYHAGKKPTPAEIGAAAASHGTHVTWSTTTPKANGTAAVGTEAKVARGDHVHPLQTTVSGNAGTATKLATARTLTIGNSGKTFDGSGNVSWSLSEIGAASSGHSHTNINFLDKRSENTTPANVSNGISLHLKSAGTAGLNDGGSYYASLFLKPWNDISGGPYANIAVTGNHNIWLRTATANDSWNSWKQIAFTSSSITGNAATATKLQNARNIKIGNTSRSFNGTADVTWTLSDIGAAASNHGHSYLPLSGGTMTGNITFGEVTSTSYPANSSKITWSGSTDGADIYYRVTASDKGQLVLNLRDDADATIGIALNGTVKTTFDTNGYYSGKANQANTLATARTINGTSFNGSANITTANWGTARTLTIGCTGKSVNGSGNVAWSLSEIGAKTRIKKVIDLSNTKTYSVDKWYPCLAGIPYDGMHDIEVAVQLNSGIKPSWATHNSGFTCNLHIKALAGGWGTTSSDSIVLNHTYGYTLANPCSYSQLNNSSNAVLWLRGGGKYFVFTDWDASWSVKTASTTISDQTVTPVTSCPSISLTKSTIIANLNGNAGTATKLQTTRSINGTNFDGSGNITTANWGTARTLTIGNTGKSVNGSGNVSWTLDEIGAPSKTGSGASGTWGISVSGNANTATKLKTARSIGITGAVSGSANFDGSGNISIDTKLRYPIPGNFWNSGAMVVSVDGIAEAGKCIDFHNTDNSPNDYDLRLQINSNSKNIVTIPSSNGTLALTTDNVASATKLQTARNIKIGNTSRSFNGTGDVTWTLSDIGAAAKSHGNHVPATQAADNKKFLRNDNTWQTVTPANIGAAPSGHTHNQILDGNSNITIAQANDRSGLDGKNNVDIASWYGVSISNGCSNGNNYGQVTFSVDARNGNVWARGTVKAPTFSGSLSGNASSATKLQTARAIKIGNTSRNFDGTGNVTWTLSDIGAAASNHSHSNYAASSHGHNYLDVKGTNTINTTANDTTAKWGAHKNSVHWYTETGKLNGQPSQWGYLVNIGQDSEVHQVWMTQSSGDLLHRGGNASGWSGSWRTILDSSNYSTWAAAKSHTHNYAAANHTHNYAASNHNHDSAYLKLSGGTLSGSLTVNNNVYSQGFCVSKKGKEVWFDIGDSDTYIWASGANKSLQITHSGDLNFDGQPVLYGGRGNNYDTATNSIYFNNSGTSHKGRISCYNEGGGDYIQLALRTADASDNYIAMYADTTKFKQNNIYLGGKKLTIATSAPSGPATGDVWINIG